MNVKSAIAGFAIGAALAGGVAGGVAGAATGSPTRARVKLDPGETVVVVLPPGSHEDEFCMDFEVRPNGRRIVQIQAVHVDECTIR